MRASYDQLFQRPFSSVSEAIMQRIPFMLLKAVLAFLLVTVSSAAGQNSAAASSSALAVRSHLALSDFFAHDPFILPYNATKTYYLYTAIGAGQSGTDRAGVVAYKSVDLKSWEGPHVVFTVPDGIWATPADGAWAPEVHAFRGKFYLFVTLHNNSKLLDEPTPVTHPVYEGKPAVLHLRGTQIFVADSPDGPFRVLGSGGSATPRSSWRLTERCMSRTAFLTWSTHMSGFKRWTARWRRSG